MNKKTYNFITVNSNIKTYEIYENILGEHLTSIDRNELKSYYSASLMNRTIRFISSLEEIGYRLQKLMKEFFSKKLNCVKYLYASKQIFSEIETKFKHFSVEDMPTVAYVVAKIHKSARQNDCVYDFFENNVSRFIENKTKENIQLERLTVGKTLDEALTSYAAI